MSNPMATTKATQVQLTAKSYAAIIGTWKRNAGAVPRPKLRTQVDTDGKVARSRDAVVSPVLGRAVPLWHAAEPLWQKFHHIYGDEPPGPWSQAIEPVARRLLVENQIVQTLGWAAAVSGLTGGAMLVLKHPILAALLIVLAGTVMTANFFYRANTVTHPLHKLADRSACRGGTGIVLRCGIESLS